MRRIALAAENRDALVASCPYADVTILRPADKEIVYIRPGGVAQGPPLPGKTMPFLPPSLTIPLQAKVSRNGQNVSTGILLWSVSVSGEYRVRSGKSFRLQAYDIAFLSSFSRPGELVNVPSPHIIGGKIKVEVRHVDRGCVNATAPRNAEIRGENPQRGDVERLIKEEAGDKAWALLRIMCHESLHQLAQFNDGKRRTPEGYPLYGAPAGVGIAQRDPEAQEWEWLSTKETERKKLFNNFFPRIFWNWQENVREGVRSFLSFYLDSEARRQLKKVHDSAPQGTLGDAPMGVLLRAAIRRYNGGREYALGHDAGGYYYNVSPSISNDYVNTVLSDPHYSNEGDLAIPEDASSLRWPPAQAPT